METFRRLYPERLQELNLDVSTVELLSAERTFAYADLYAMLANRNTILWLTPHTAVARADAAGIFTDSVSWSTTNIFVPWLAPLRRFQRLLILSVAWCWLIRRKFKILKPSATLIWDSSMLPALRI
jgi:hypothetical protein